MALIQITVLILSATVVICYPSPRWEQTEYGENFEGDMILTSKQRDAIYGPIDPDNRNGLRDVTKRWPNNTIVYHISEEDFDEEQIQLIDEAIENIANKSCLKFRRRDQCSEHAVLIQGSGNGCYSNVGFNDKEDDEGEIHQVLNLAKGCFKIGTVIHEMLHTLGFYHMQSSYDRDNYVTIVWENIIAGQEHNFKKYNEDFVTDFGVPYDYGSVMHYSAKAFSKNGNDTIIPVKENITLGQRLGMSESDIMKLNKMYCEESNEASTTEPSGSSENEITVIYE